MGKWFLTIGALSLLGCGENFEARSALDQANRGIFVKTDDRPACEIQPAEYAVNLDVVAFELESDTGLSMGWDFLSGFVRAIQASFTLKTARLNLSMSLYDPMKPHYELTSVLGQSRLWNLNFKFNLGFQQIGAGFEHYSQTPFSQLTKDGLANTLDHLTGQMAKLQDDWSTEVVAVPNAFQVVVPVGSFTGLKVGDQFAIYNIEHVWEGTPCHSEHLLTRKTTSDPVAIAEAVQLENSAALLNIVPSQEFKGSHGTIRAGALVEIHKLAGKKRHLRRTLEIGRVGSAVLQFDNSQKVDIGPYLSKQLHAIASRHGFIIYDP